MIKKLLAAISSVFFISGASLAVCYAAGDSTGYNDESQKVYAASTSNSTTGTSTSVTTVTTAEITPEPTTLQMFHITFLDFDGNPMTTIDVEDGDPINYESIDTSKLHKHIDVNTEQEFSSWDIKPDFADKDYTIRALSKTATIKFNKPPIKKRYFSTRGNISLKGLEVSIKLVVQTPEKDDKGNYKTEESIVDVSESCIAEPSKASEAFANGNKATITVYPSGDKKSLCKFDIVCYRNLGDVNLDGSIDSADASQVLSAYANMAASRTYEITDKLKELADVNMDKYVDTRDASYILKYYALASTASDFMDWEDILDYDKILGTS